MARVYGEKTVAVKVAEAAKGDGHQRLQQRFAIKLHAIATQEELI
jgi:hypothetical protein